MKEEKTVEVYGVKLTSMQEMQFSKYLSNKGIAMNTLQPKERTNIVKTWLAYTRTAPTK